MSNIPEVTESALNELICSASNPVVVECFTRACIPCKRIAPMLEEIQKEFSHRLSMARVDIERHGEVATRYDIAAVPSVLVFLNGTMAVRAVGVIGKQDLLRKINTLLTGETT